MSNNPSEETRDAGEGELGDEALEQISGGTGLPTDAPADLAGEGLQTDVAPDRPPTTGVMKTKHDTVKNSISNVR